MIEAPVWYRLVVIEISKTRDYYATERARLSEQEDAEVASLSAIITKAREKCTHEYPVLFKEALSSHAHANDTYICTNCTAAHHGRSNAFPSTEIIQVTQEELMRFFCK